METDTRNYHPVCERISQAAFINITYLLYGRAKPHLDNSPATTYTKTKQKKRARNHFNKCLVTNTFRLAHQSQRLKDECKRTLLESAAHCNKSLGAEQTHKIKRG